MHIASICMYTMWMQCGLSFVCHLGPSIPQKFIPSGKESIPPSRDRVLCTAVHWSPPWERFISQIQSANPTAPVCGCLVVMYPLESPSIQSLGLLMPCFNLFHGSCCLKIKSSKCKCRIWTKDERRSPQMKAVSSVRQNVCLCGSCGLQAEKGYHEFATRDRQLPSSNSFNRPLGSHNHLH